MDTRFIFALIFIACAVTGRIIYGMARRPERWIRWTLIAALVAGVVLLFLSFWAIVPVNTVSIGNSFGRPTVAYGNGWNVKAPWVETIDFDGSRQFLPFEGKGDPDKHIFPCINVRLSSNATACLSGVAEWQMVVDTPEQRAKALALYRDYKTFDRLRDNYMIQRVRTALGIAFRDHNPLIPEKNLPLDKLNEAATTSLKQVIGDTVTVFTVTLNIPDYDETTDAAIAKQQAEYANTATAAQKVLTADQEAQAAAKLQAALQGNPEYTTNKCLDITREAVTRGQPVEPGLCMGAGSGVLLNRNK